MDVSYNCHFYIDSPKCPSGAQPSQQPGYEFNLYPKVPESQNIAPEPQNNAQPPKRAEETQQNTGENVADGWTVVNAESSSNGKFS